MTNQTKYTFFGALCLMLSAFSLLIDILIETGGIRARTLDQLWFMIFVGISIVVHMAFLLSPLFRHATGGKKHAWTLVAVPLLFLYSLGATLVGQSSYIQSQASQVENAREIKKARLALVKSYQKSAKIQQRHQYATRSNVSLDKAAAVLDDASKAAASANINNSQAVELPLSIINAALPRSQKMSVKTFLIIFYTLMSFGLILIGYFFSELALVMFDKAGDNVQTINRPRDINDLRGVGRLTDADTDKAIELKLAERDSWKQEDITRAWIDNACRRAYGGKSRKGQTLDKFIKPTRKKIKKWYKVG